MLIVVGNGEIMKITYVNKKETEELSSKRKTVDYVIAIWFTLFSVISLTAPVFFEGIELSFIYIITHLLLLAGSIAILPIESITSVFKKIFGSNWIKWRLVILLIFNIAANLLVSFTGISIV